MQNAYESDLDSPMLATQHIGMQFRREQGRSNIAGWHCCRQGLCSPDDARLNLPQVT